jgi:hypothetical protein
MNLPEPPTEVVSPTVNGKDNYKDIAEKYRLELEELQSRMYQGVPQPTPTQPQPNPKPAASPQPAEEEALPGLDRIAEYFTKVYSNAISYNPDINKQLELNLLFGIFCELKQLREENKK